MENDISELLKIKQGNYKNSWREVEAKIGITFPEDYKKIIDLYGGGGINEFLWILSPFSENKNLNSVDMFQSMKDAYLSMKSEFPEQFIYDFYSEGRGLFPWGITDNGDELYWNIKDDTLEIVIYEARYASEMSYPMSMEEFLCKLLRKEIICSIFPDDFILEENYYEKYK